MAEIGAGRRWLHHPVDVGRLMPTLIRRRVMAKRLNIRDIMPQLLTSAQPRKARMLRVECQHKRAPETRARRLRRRDPVAHRPRNRTARRRRHDPGGRAARRAPAIRSPAAAERFYESRRLLWLDHLWQDVRSAARNLAKCPVACAEAVMWETLFDRRPDAVGAAIWIDNQPHVVVGVMPERFWFSAMMRRSGRRSMTPPFRRRPVSTS